MNNKNKQVFLLVPKAIILLCKKKKHFLAWSVFFLSWEIISKLQILKAKVSFQSQKFPMRSDIQFHFFVRTTYQVMKVRPKIVLHTLQGLIQWLKFFLLFFGILTDLHLHLTKKQQPNFGIFTLNFFNFCKVSHFF